MKTKLLPPLSLFLFLLLGTYCAKAQYVNIPDTAFVNWLNANAAPAMNGSLMDTTSPWILNITTFNSNNTNIQNLEGVQYFDNVTNFICQNGIRTLPAFPPSLNSILLDNAVLSAPLPPFPQTLQWLMIRYSMGITSIPALPANLYSFSLNNTFGLTTLPALPASLKIFLLANISPAAIPVLPVGLERLELISTHLSVLPVFPPSLSQISVTDNLFTTLPALPDSLYLLDVSNNPNLHCLPELKRIVTFSFNNTGITCLPNTGTITNSYPPLDSVPLCELSNTQGCPVFWNISGKAYMDTSLNCQFDNSEFVFRNLKVNLYENGVFQQQNITSATGSYNFVTGFSTYTYSVDTSGLPFALACPASGYHQSIISLADSIDSDMDFGFHCKAGFDLAAQSIVAGFVPGVSRRVRISAGDAANFYGARCAQGVTGTVQLVINGPTHYSAPIAGALTPTSVTADTITWNIADFGAVNFFSDFNVWMLTDTTATLGTPVCLTLILNPLNGDNNPANNILTQCFNVVSSYDPNEKEVSPAGNIDTAQQWLTYTIQFQNTGTAEALNIHVDDTLDTDVDALSFQLLAYSHQPVVQLRGNALRFNFPNINLPDSNTNEPLSHGYVQYKVKLKNNLLLGTVINNTAFIYFDFNAPVVTNTTTNTITTNTGITTLSTQQSSFSIYPNPASSVLTVSVPEPLLKGVLLVCDITGREVLKSVIENSKSEMSTTGLANGIYFVTIRKNGLVSTQKLVVQR